MNTNLKILDKFRETENVYKLIVQLAGRSHAIMANKNPALESLQENPVKVAMEELMNSGEI